MCRFLLFIFEGIEFKIHWVISWLGCWVCCAVNSVGLVLGYLFVLKLYYIYHVQRCQPSLHSHVFFSSSPARVISYYFPVILNMWETDGYVIFPVILNLSETDGYVILPVILNLSETDGYVIFLSFWICQRLMDRDQACRQPRVQQMANWQRTRAKQTRMTASADQTRVLDCS